MCTSTSNMKSMYLHYLHVEFIEVSHSSVCKHGSCTGEHVHKNIILYIILCRLHLQMDCIQLCINDSCIRTYLHIMHIHMWYPYVHNMKLSMHAHIYSSMYVHNIYSEQKVSSQFPR